MNYEELLDEWSEHIYQEANKYKAISNEQPEINYKYSYCLGVSDGLIKVLAMLNLLENKYKKNLNRGD